MHGYPHKVYFKHTTHSNHTRLLLHEQRAYQLAHSPEPSPYIVQCLGVHPDDDGGDGVLALEPMMMDLAAYRCVAHAAGMSPVFPARRGLVLLSPLPSQSVSADRSAYCNPCRDQSIGPSLQRRLRFFPPDTRDVATVVKQVRFVSQMPAVAQRLSRP